MEIVMETYSADKCLIKTQQDITAKESLIKDFINFYMYKNQAFKSIRRSISKNGLIICVYMKAGVMRKYYIYN